MKSKSTEDLEWNMLLDIVMDTSLTEKKMIFSHSYVYSLLVVHWNLRIFLLSLK